MLDNIIQSVEALKAIYDHPFRSVKGKYLVSRDEVIALIRQHEEQAAPAVQSEEDREAFEVYAKSQDWSTHRHTRGSLWGEDYKSEKTRNAWANWQAALAWERQRGAGEVTDA